MKKSKHKITKERLKSIALAVLILTLIPAIVSAQQKKGKALYDEWCAGCHGYEGKGEGYAKEFTYPKPRDFAFGTFKFRSTETGEPPADADIKRIIREGNPGTSMSAWKQFSDDELDALVDYIKGFAPENFEFPGERIKITKTPEVNDEIIKKGKDLYEKIKCWECHGRHARGSGEKVLQEQKDEWGYRIYPADLTHPWELKNGSSVEDLFISITTGIEGTPMSSYQQSMTDNERWALAYYLKSLQFKRKLSGVLRTERLQSIPSSTDDALWDSLDYIDIPLAGQLMFATRHFTATLTNVRVRGLYTDSEIAIMLEWDDKVPNKGNDGLPPDAVRLQFPVRIISSAEKPYFYMGDKENPVKLWYWNASDNFATELIAKGAEKDSIIKQEQEDVAAISRYSDGLYRVIFKRQLETRKEDDVMFTLGKFIPFSVSVYDGQNKEEENKASVSVWYNIILEPSTPLRVYFLPPLASFAVLYIGILFHRKLKKNR